MKIERLLSLIILLLVKELVTAKEMAERFNVSQRTIYRDIATLEGAGFPIVAKYGSEGGYSLMAGFKLDAYTFTDEEKSWLLKAVELQGDLLKQTEVGQVIADKLRILYGEKEPDLLSISFRDGTIHHTKIEEAVKEKIAQLTTAMSEQSKVRLSYVANTGEVTERIIWPLQLRLENGSWFLWSFCELRQNERLFKLTRILEFSVLNAHYDWQKVALLIQPTRKLKESTQLVCCRFNRSEYGKLLDFFVKDQLTILASGQIDVHFENPTEGNLLPFLLMFGDRVRVLSPAKVITQHQQAIAQLTNLYKS